MKKEESNKNPEIKGDRVYPGFGVPNDLSEHVMAMRVSMIAKHVEETTPYKFKDIEKIVEKLLQVIDWDVAVTMYRKFGIDGLKTLPFKKGTTHMMKFMDEAAIMGKKLQSFNTPKQLKQELLKRNVCQRMYLFKVITYRRLCLQSF